MVQILISNLLPQKWILFNVFPEPFRVIVLVSNLNNTFFGHKDYVWMKTLDKQWEEELAKLLYVFNNPGLEFTILMFLDWEKYWEHNL